MINAATIDRLYRVIDSTPAGSIVCLTTLRASFPTVSKADFDGFFAQAHTSGEIQMHDAEQASLLTDSQRADYVDSGGTYHPYFTR